MGRERELEQLESFLNAAVAGKGKTVFISGEAGSGKTRLVREFLKVVKVKGVSVMAGWCLSEAAAPYFPFVEAFHSYFASYVEEEQPTSQQRPETSLGIAGTAQMISGERGIAAWLTGSAPLQKTGRAEAVSPQVWKDQIYAGVAGTLHSIAARAPVILFLEDIHWADSASLALLHYLARAVDNTEKVLVLATYRSEELTADAEGHSHPLLETLRAMRREDLFAEIKLQSLSQTHVAEIAKNMIGGNLQPQLAKKLAAESKGNPLFVVESLRMLNERKSLVQENDEWLLATDEIGIPSKIKDIILRRLAILKYPQRRVLDAASVIGEKFDVELLGTVLGLDYLEVLETLNVIAHATSLVSLEENCYRFDHARSRETLYEELSPPLKRGYHQRVAEKLETIRRSGKAPNSDLAYHYAQAGNAEKAEKFALAAGQDALERFGNTEAIKHFKYVLEAIGDDPKRAEERTIALEGLGDAHYASSMLKDATRIYEELCNATETSVVRLRAFRKAMHSAGMYGDTLHQMELVKKAEPYVAADRLESARIRLEKGLALMGHASWPAAVAEQEAALKVFEEESSLWDVAHALSMLSSRALLGMLHEGLADCLRSIALFEELGDFRLLIWAYNMAGLIFSNCSLRHEALEMYAKVVEVDDKVKMGDYNRLSFAIGLSARQFWVGENFEEALSYSLRALEITKKTDSLVTKGMVYSNLTIVYSRLGDMTHAEEYFEKLTKLPPEILTHSNVFGELARAVFYAAKSQWKESEQYFREPIEYKNMYNNLPASARAGIAAQALRVKTFYAWALERQGRFEEAKVQRENNEKMLREAEEKLAHTYVQASLMVRRQAVIEEEFEMRLDLVNVARKPGMVVRIEGLIPAEFKVANLPDFCSVHDDSLETKGKSISPWQVMTIKLRLKATKPGTYNLNPNIHYVDDLGESKTCKPNPVAIIVQSAKPTFEVLPNRLSTGYSELDRLLLGGIPENHAVILSSPPIDERALLVRKFLETGANQGETTFLVTVDAGSRKTLAEKYPSSFYLLVCNPQSDAMIQSAPNISKLKGVENLTEIDIALTKTFRTLLSSAAGPKRICIEILSDVLLQHHAVHTRRWLSALLPTLKQKGFTILTVVDPQMHPPEELQAILGVFDGEIRVSEKETAEGTKQTLKIRKLYNQKYLANEVIITKERLAA